MDTIFTAAAIAHAGDFTESLALGHHRILVTAADTGGSLGVWEEIVQPGWGPPLHVHHAEDEMFHVLEGRIRIWCGAETFEVTAGATAVLPREVPHRFENVGETIARMLIAVTPGGFETSFLDAAALTEQSEAAIMKLAAEYRLGFLPPAGSKAA
jgi:mannose-6-phosphate isomerase-like protein (cupin superfamily)